MSMPRGRSVNPTMSMNPSSSIRMHHQPPQSHQQSVPVSAARKSSALKRLFQSSSRTSPATVATTIVATEEQPLEQDGGLSTPTTITNESPLARKSERMVSQNSSGNKVRLLHPRRMLHLKKPRKSEGFLRNSNHKSAHGAQNPMANVMSFLTLACPSDVLPKILAFGGPQKTAALAKTNRHWRNLIVNQEGTWRVLCEELYKWKKGDPEPASWFQLYRMTPCVPVDYPTIAKAVAIASSTPPAPSRRGRNHHNQDAVQQTRSVRILLRPGTFYLKEAIVIQAIANCSVSIETVDLPENIFRSPLASASDHTISSDLDKTSSSHTSSTPFKETATSLRNLMLCRTPSTVEETEFPSDSEQEDEVSSSPPKHATLVLRTRRSNEPVFRVRQGLLCLKNVEIQHNSHGLDIWNGNAAVQIQPPVGDDEAPVHVDPRPCAWLERVHVSSKSGRGIVNIDGGKVVIRQCAVTDCAATGIYIGGPGSQAYLETTDVLRNGVGNKIRRGIARGHSGVYLEQGAARILDCNICLNTLTGISAVSPDNAILSLEASDLVANGTYQLEMPPLGTVARQRSLTRHNHLSAVLQETGRQGRVRSGLLSMAERSTAPASLAAALVPGMVTV